MGENLEIISKSDLSLYYIQGNSYTDMAEKLVKICEIDENKKRIKGELARNFVMKNKNNVVQTKKIIEMFNNYLKDKSKIEIF